MGRVDIQIESDGSVWAGIPQVDVRQHVPRMGQLGGLCFGRAGVDGFWLDSIYEVVAQVCRRALTLGLLVRKLIDQATQVGVDVRPRLALTATGFDGLLQAA